MRLHQWIKNVILFAGIIFAKKLFDFHLLSKTILGFFLFSLIASSQYVINDYLDKNQDALHPEKKFRPLASGSIDASYALFLTCIILTVTLILAYLLNPGFFFLCLFYFFFNLLYSKVLKNLVILDVMSISIGFVIRAIAGAVLIHVSFSSWLILCTFMLSLFWGFSKRRGEILLLEDKANSHRKILQEYSPEFLNLMMSISSTMTLISYVMYTMSPTTIQNLGTDKLFYTIPIVAYAIFRSLYIIYIKNMGHNPSKAIITDISVLISGLFWLLLVSGILYTKLFDNINFIMK
jgi:4-hydroxybenzoate polyprenyltransferase